MVTPDLGSMMLEAACLLNGTVCDTALNSCNFELHEAPIILNVSEGPAGSYVVGKMGMAPLLIEESGSQILYAMYMNGKLTESLGMPTWFIVDAEDNRLWACFSISTSELDARKLAQALTPLDQVMALGFKT
jgi:hypothetical protein